MGVRSTSVWVNDETDKMLSPHKRGVRLCEAVHLSFNHPVKLTRENDIGPGVMRSLSLDRDDKALTQFI